MPTIVRIYLVSNILTLCNCLVYSSEDLVNAKDAESRCEHNGGLVKYDKLIDNGGSVDLDPKIQDSLGLSDGETAWIHGSVSYSKYFLAWYGCADLITLFDIPTKQLNGNKNPMYVCMEVCVKYKSINVKLIGLKGHMCYCFNESRHVSYNSKCFASTQQVQYPWDYNGIDSKLLNVYRVFDERSMLGDMSSSDLLQCTIAKVNAKKQVLHETRSCFSKPNHTELMKDAYVCVYDERTHSLKVKCNKTFTSSDTHKNHCEIKMSVSLPSARSSCRNIPGQLVPFYNPSKFKELTPNKTYWADMFRVFKVLSTIPDDQHSDISLKTCLGLTRIGTRIYLDPDICSTPKRFICADVFLPSSPDKPDIIVYISVTLAGIAFIIAASAILICLVRRNVYKKAMVPGKQEYQNTDPNSNVNPPENYDIIDANYSEVDAEVYAEPVSIGAVVSSSDDYDHITHHKSAPSQILQHGNVYGCAHQFGNNDEYDVLNTRGNVKQKTRSTVNPSSSHVYDSTSCFKEEKIHSMADVVYE